MWRNTETRKSIKLTRSELNVFDQVEPKPSFDQQPHTNYHIMLPEPRDTGDTGSSPEEGKISWRRKWQLTPVFTPGKIPWTEETGGLQSMGSQRVRHNLVSEQTQEWTVNNLVFSESKKSEFVDAKIKYKCQ